MAPSDVILNGDMADKALKQLNESSNLDITRDEETGKLSATGKAKNKADKTLLAAINDENITVNVDATSSNEVQVNGNTVDLLVGAFQGNKVNSDGTVTANTTVNPNQAEVAAKTYGTEAGVYVGHEILESYSAAVDSPGTKAPTPSDVQNNTDTGKAYTKAHNNAKKLDNRFVEPTFIIDNSKRAVYLEYMKDVSGVPLPFETELYKKNKK